MSASVTSAFSMSASAMSEDENVPVDKDEEDALNEQQANRPNDSLDCLDIGFARGTMERVDSLLPLLYNYDATTHELVNALKNFPYFPRRIIDDLEKVLCQHVASSAASKDVEDANVTGDTQQYKRRRTSPSQEVATSTTKKDAGDGNVAADTQQRKQRSAEELQKEFMQLLNELSPGARRQFRAEGDETAIAEDSEEREAANKAQEALKAWTEAMKAETEAAKARREAAAKAEIEAYKAVTAAYNARIELFGLVRNLTRVDSAIREMAYFSQVGPSNLLGTGTREQADHEAKECGVYGKRTTGGTSTLVRTLFQNTPKFGPNFLNLHDPDASLKLVAQALNEWVSRAVILIGVKAGSAQPRNVEQQYAETKKDYKEKIELGATWFKSRVSRLLDAHYKRDPPKAKEMLKEGRETTDIFFPGAVGNEVCGCHVVVAALLEAIANCVTQLHHHEMRQGNRPPLPPRKVRILEEAVLYSKEPHVQEIGVVLGKEGRIFIMFDDNLKMPFQLKPLCRRKMNVDRLDAEARDQIVGHFARFVGGAFNLFGCGTSGRATGLTGNQCYIRVHHLRLEMKEDEGECAKLSSKKSGRLPLLSRESFSRVINASANLDDTQKKKLLKIQEGDFQGGTDVESLPPGIQVLFSLLQMRRRDLLGYDLEALATDQYRPYDVLGSGTFGVVMGCDEDQSHVLKVCAVQDLSFEREVAALQAIGTESKHLPRLLQNANFPIKLGEKQFKATCLKLEPRGIPIHARFLRKKDVLQAAHDVLLGLRTLHLKEFVHNDVSPNNIVYDGSEEGRFVLVDLGLATTTTAVLKGFQGTVSYAHIDVFSKYPNESWSPKKEYDLEALQFTIAALFNNCQPTWDMSGALPRNKRNGETQAMCMEYLSSWDETRKEEVNQVFLDKKVAWDKNNYQLIDTSLTVSSELSD